MDLNLSAARKAARGAVDKEMRARTYDRHAYDEETYRAGVRDIARAAVAAAAPLIERQVREQVGREIEEILATYVSRLYGDLG